MKKEKVMYVDLPKDTEYRKAYVTEDGKVAITYAEETAPVSKALPKPTPLVGGTEVYQKEGLPYWYCKIKGGRDEFMHLYFGDLSSDDILYTADGKEREFTTEKQKQFEADVIEALGKMPKENFRWIPVYEPSEADDDGNLQYIPETNAFRGSPSGFDWEIALQNYSPKNGSKMATITTYFLLLLRLLKDGFATIEQLADNSKGIGQRQLGGLCGLAGNTYKIANDPKSDSGYWQLGGDEDHYKHEFPLAYAWYDDEFPFEPAFDGVGLLELTK